MSGTYQHREGSGSLFPNKKGSDNHPDMKGDAMVNGVVVEVAAWRKTTASGKEFLSLKISGKRQSAPPRDPPPGRGGDVDSEIPFSACKE